LDRKPKSSSYDKHFRGTIKVHTSGATQELGVVFSESDEDERITIGWDATHGGRLTLADLASNFGFSEMPPLPPSLSSVGLSKVNLTYDFRRKILVGGLVVTHVVDRKEEPLGQAVFCSLVLDGET